MISITKNDVPEYLRSGILFSSLEGGGCEVFEVPANVMKLNLTLNDKDDLLHLLSSLRYWMVMNASLELVRYCLQPETEVLPCLDADQDLPYLPALRRVQQRSDPEKQLDEAASAGNRSVLECVVKLVAVKGPVKLRARHFGFALRSNNIECIRYLVEQGCPHNVNRSFCYTNNVECLKYVLTHCPKFKPSFNDCIRGTNDTAVVDCLLKHGHRWDSETMRQCAGSDSYSLAIIRHLHERGCNDWDGVTRTAAASGRLEVLQYAHEHGVSWDALLTFHAACSSHPGALQCLQYAVTHGCPWAEDTLQAAAHNDKWHLFQYALVHGCPYHPSVAAAVAGLHLPTLQYLIEHGYGWDADECLDHAIRALTIDVETLRYLRRHGTKWSSTAADILVQGGHLPALQFAHEDGLRFNSPELYLAAVDSVRNQLGIVKFLHQCGCPWDHQVVTAAVTLHCTAYPTCSNGCCRMAVPSPRRTAPRTLRHTCSIQST